METPEIVAADILLHGSRLSRQAVFDGKFNEKKAKEIAKSYYGVVEFKHKKDRRTIVEENPYQVIKGKEVKAEPFRARIPIKKLPPNPHWVPMTEKFPVIDKNYECCRKKECAFLGETYFHCSMVASEDEPHPKDDKKRVYSRSEMAKLNPRKTRMPGYFDANVRSIFKIAPGLFKKNTAREPFQKQEDAEILQKWEECPASGYADLP
ncbi:hypothetical protein L596_016659 [Steinernema carpocapsae]|uniref:Uncharacterized protein n=1 Tax=Steinernema carpocapsae TaxID=34508 RepID=A0A4U5NIN1_STECR|nr:hypothetical protein L596_016659 [Steinernema carpocapsae]